MTATAVRYVSPQDARRGASAPDRSVEQRFAALERANMIRSRRAALKRDVKAGRLAVVPLLLNPPEYAETMKVFDLLLSIPKYGRVKVNKVLSRCRIAPSKNIGGMSSRQRREVAAMLAPVDRFRWGSQ